MNLSRKHKAYAAVIALALGALAVDRFILGGGPIGPGQASASEPSADGPVSRATPSKPLPSTDEKVAATQRMAIQLAAVARRENVDPAGVRNAFRPADSWLPPPPAKADAAPADDPAARNRAKAEAFAKAHRLMAVVASDAKGNLAIVNDRTLLPGQKIDGFTLVALGEGTAEFAVGDVRVTLKLHTDPTPRAKR